MNRDRFSGAGRFPRYLFSATKFLIFFALIAFVVTCSFLLFLDSMRLDPDILRENALLTFLNILLLSALFTVIDGIRRRLTAVSYTHLMYCTRAVSDAVTWVGGNDRRLSLFENLFPIPRGVTYNSYLILDEKTALIDTVDASNSVSYTHLISNTQRARPTWCSAAVPLTPRMVRYCP